VSSQTSTRAIPFAAADRAAVKKFAAAVDVREEAKRRVLAAAGYVEGVYRGGDSQALGEAIAVLRTSLGEYHEAVAAMLPPERREFYLRCACPP
jgi:hypothetical protein